MFIIMLLVFLLGVMVFFSKSVVVVKDCRKFNNNLVGFVIFRVFSVKFWVIVDLDYVKEDLLVKELFVILMMFLVVMVNFIIENVLDLSFNILVVGIFVFFFVSMGFFVEGFKKKGVKRGVVVFNGEFKVCGKFGFKKK